MFPFVSGTHPYGVSTHGVSSDHDSWYFGSYGKNRNSLVDHQGRASLLRDRVRIDVISGSWIYLGLALHHWGHFCQDILHRLWLSQFLPDDTGLLLIERKVEARRAITNWLTQVQDLFNLTPRPVLFVDELSQVEQLFVPEPGMVDNTVTFAFAKWAGEATNVKPDSRFPSRLFLSRRGFDLMGRLAGSNSLIQQLNSQGWFEFQPQLYPIARQLEILASADSVIFEEGSSQYLAMLLGRSAPKNFVLKRRGGHSLDNLLPSLHVSTHMSPEAENLQLMGRGADNSLGFLGLKRAQELTRELENFTGCDLSLSDYIRSSHSDLERWRTYSDWKNSGAFEFSRSHSLQERVAALENLGNAVWTISKRKFARDSGIAFAIDYPRNEGHESIFFQPEFKDLNVSGWLISKPGTTYYFESDQGRIDFQLTHDREAVKNLYSSMGYTHATARIGFSALVPWWWRKFTLKASLPDEDHEVLVTFSRS